MYNSKNYTCNISNVNIHANRVIYASGGGNTNFKVNIDNCNYYETFDSVEANMKDSYTFYFESNSSFYVNITNSLFYYPEGLLATNVFIRCHGKSGGVHQVTVENCDIIGKTEQDVFNIYNATLAPEVQFNNCRIYNGNGNKTYTTYLGENTLYTSTLHKDSTTTITAGYVSTPVTNTETYTVPTTTAPAIGADGKISIGAEETVIDVEFTYEVQKCSEVSECFDDVRLSMLYYTNFDMMLYIEANEAATINSLTGFTYSGNVKIDGKEFCAYSKESSVTGVSDDVTAKLTYTIDGKSYRQTFVVSALVYAELILNDPIEDVEARAVANMVRFIKEARAEAGLAISNEFTELAALYAIDGYKDKSEYNDIAVDTTGLSGVSMSFAIDGTNAGYVIKLNESTFAEAKDAVITVTYADGTAIEATGAYVEATEDAEAYYKLVTTKTKVYDIVDQAIVITITMPNSTLTGTYSVGAYIDGTDNALAKAMYEFGVAAKAYRDYLEVL